MTAALTTMPHLKQERSLDFSPCKGCNVCAEACPTGAIGDSFARERCNLCFRCVLLCPAGEDFGEKYVNIEENIWGL